MSLAPLSIRDPAYLAYLLVFAAAAAACLAGAWRARSISDRGVRRGLTSLLGLSGLWALAHVGMLLAPSLWGKTAFYEAGLTVGFGTVFAWVWLCSAFSGRSLHRNRTVLRVGLAVLLAVMLTKLTNRWHGLYFSAGWTAVPFQHLAVDHHALYWITAGLSYMGAAVGFFMLAEPLRRAQVGGKKLAGLFGLTALPLGANAVGYAGPWLLDVSHEPVGVAAFAIGVLFVSRTRFREAARAGRRDEPALVLSEEGRIRNYNQPAARLFPAVQREEAVGTKLSAVLPELYETLPRKNGSDPEAVGSAGPEAVGRQAAGAKAAGDRAAGAEAGSILKTSSDGKAAGHGEGSGEGVRYLRPVETTFQRGGGRLVVLADVTERELRRREREARLEAISTSIPGVVFEFRAGPAENLSGNLSGNPSDNLSENLSENLSGGERSVESVGPEAETLLGLCPDPDGFYDRFVGRIPGSHQEEVLRSIEEAVQGRKQWQKEIPFDRPSGSGRPSEPGEPDGSGGERIWLLGSAEPETRETPEGEEVVFRGVLLDITEQKEQEQGLRRQAKKLRSITENVSDGIYRSTEEDGIVYANSAFAEMFGYRDLQELRETDGKALYADPARREELIEKEAEEGGLDAEEVQYRRKDGSTFTGLLSTQQVEGREEGKTYFDGAITDVTEQARERRRRKQAIQRTTDGIVEVGPDWQVTLVNDQAEKVYGMEEAEMLGRSAWEVFPNMEGTCFEEAYREAMQTRKPSSVEAHYSGLGEWFDVQIYPNEDGGLSFYFDVITERKERERRLAVTSQRLKAILQHTSRPMFMKNREQEYLLTNQRFQELHGLETGEALGQTDRDLFPPEMARSVQEDDRRVLREGKTVEQEERIWADGEWRTYLTAKSPLYDIGTEKDPDAPVALFGTATDITERKRREQELKQADTLFEHAQDALFLIDVSTGPDGSRTYTVERVNPAYEEKTGLPASDLVGQEPEGIVGAEVGRQIEARYEQAAAEQVPLEYEEELPIGGEKTCWSTRIAPVVVGGVAEKIVGTTRDITEQKRREEKLAEAKKEAEAASRAKSAFLASMSHEIRTPLTSILGFAEAIGEEIQGAPMEAQSASETAQGSSEEARDATREIDLQTLTRFSRLIEEGGRRLLDTLDAVLNLSKLEAGQMELSSEPVDLSAQARQVAEELRPQAEEKGLALEAQTDEEEVLALADKGGVQIVVQNLLSNAMKYTEEGDIQVRARRESGRAIIEVEDTGIGMESEMAEDLFEPFRQASEGVAREYEGTGVGLAVTRKAAEEMGGSVEVDTQKDEGSRFTVRLPQADREVEKSG